MSEKNLANYLFILLCLFLSTCISIPNQYKGLPPGIWRAELRLNQNLPSATDAQLTKENFDFTELPFNFEVKYPTPDSFIIEIINGQERISVSDISFGIDRKTAKDTLIINFPVYDTYIKAIYEEGILEGDWYVNYKDNYSIPFKAFHGKDHRFDLSTESTNEFVEGKWETSFDYNKESPYPAIGDFHFEQDRLLGTFKTETGDYRFLEGQAKGNNVQLSCFDGAHAFLFESKLLPDSSMVGTFYSGKHYTSDYVSKKNADVQLKSVYELTVPISDEAFDFNLKDTDGKMISLSDAKYQNKSKLIQIMGTWCPNCRDETKFLKAFYDKKPENLEIVSIGFERYREESKAIAALNRYKENMDLPYPVLHGGYFSKSEASEVFPMLNKIISYPTLIFLDKNNQIIKIHTGFNGPATDEYTQFKEEFDLLIIALTK